MQERPRHLKLESDKKLFHELKHRINKKIDELPRHRIYQLKIKLLLYPLVYFGLYVFALNHTDKILLFFLSYALMGFMVVIIFCELIHELVHGNIFHKTCYNKIALKLFDILGANSFIWQKRHLTLHHHFPNVNSWDADIEQKGLVAIFPNEENKNVTKYQHRYVFLLYPLFMLNWLFVRDFRDFFSEKRIVRKAIKIPRIEYFKLFFFKTAYIFMFMVVPVAYKGMPIMLAIGGLFFLTVSGSILAMAVLLTPHINIGNEFSNVNTKGEIDITWFNNQLVATNDIDYCNWLTRNFMGNFNFHVVHHLFPNLSSVYAPEATKVLKSFCEEYGLPYKSYPMSLAFKKHYQLIQKNAISFHEMDL